MALISSGLCSVIQASPWSAYRTLTLSCTTRRTPARRAASTTLATPLVRSTSWRRQAPGRSAARPTGTFVARLITRVGTLVGRRQAGRVEHVAAHRHRAEPLDQGCSAKPTG